MGEIQLAAKFFTPEGKLTPAGYEFFQKYGKNFDMEALRREYGLTEEDMKSLRSVAAFEQALKAVEGLRDLRAIHTPEMATKRFYELREAIFDAVDEGGPMVMAKVAGPLVQHAKLDLEMQGLLRREANQPTDRVTININLGAPKVIEGEVIDDCADG